VRIAFVTPEFVTENYYSGGLANYVHRVSRALYRLGHEVHVITFSDSNEDVFDFDGIRVHRLTSKGLRKTVTLLSCNRLRSTAQWIDFSLQVYLKLKYLHRQKPFDVVQFPNSRACGLATRFFLRVPHVVRISCYRPVWNDLAGIGGTLDAKATEWLEEWYLRQSRNIYAPSQTLKSMLDQNAHIQNVAVIHPPFYLETTGFDPSLYNSQLKDKKYLLFFGRFQLHKGFHVLAKALPDVLNEHSDCYAVLVGMDAATHLSPSMKEYARLLCGKNSDRLIFFGQTPHEQLYPIIQGARIIVLPSLIDNLPNTCLEAMALQKPVVGTIGASFDEGITDEKTGFLVPSGDETALANKIITAWTNPRLDEIGRAAADRVAEFSPEQTLQRLVAYYTAIVKGYEHR